MKEILTEYLSSIKGFVFTEKEKEKILEFFNYIDDIKKDFNYLCDENDKKDKQLEAYENMRKEAIEYIKNDMKLKNYFEITERGADDLLDILNKVGEDNE